MPAKPGWFDKIDSIVRELEGLSQPFVDRATVEFLLGVGRRRAQQIMAPCIGYRVGANGLAERQLLVDRLRQLAGGDDGHYERQRRRRLGGTLARLQKERLERPQLLVEAPVEVVNQELANLPGGVRLGPGRITVEFEAPQEALEKLLALAMAISNNYAEFDRVTQRPSR